MESKEEIVLEPFFNSPRHWHFEELLKKVKISRPQLSRWLKKLEKKRLIRKVKLEGRMPYYIHVFENISFKSKKRLFALKKFTESGFIDHLASLNNAKVVVIFGSFSRADWHENSDIDLFIYGEDNEFKQGKYELKLGREIQMHTAKNKKDLKRMSRLLPYILSGDFIKGSVAAMGVDINA